MTVSEFETTYRQLHEQMLRGELAEEDFKSEVEQLRFKDDLGTQWKIGWYTGKWYRYEEGQWVQDKPPAQQAPAPPVSAAGAPPPAEDSRTRRSLTPCLVVALIALLLLASIVLIFGWNTDRWGTAGDDLTAEVEATAVAQATSPGEPSPTEASAPLPSDTAQATKTARATATSVSRSTATPSRTAAPTSTRQRATFTAEASGASATPTKTARPTTSPAATTSRTPTTEATTKPTPTKATTKPSPTAASGLSGRIYFPVYDANPDRRTFDIHVFRLDSGERDVLIGQASEPALSPDGKRMAYRSWDSSSRGILVRELADGNTWFWVRFHEAAHPSWSPNSQNITFSSQQELDRRWRLYRTWGLDSDRVRREGGDIFGRVPVWSADGRIVYWECPIDKCGLYAISGDGTGLTRLTDREHDTAPATSPDGGQLAFMSNIDGNWEIYLTSTHPAGGQQVQPVTRLTKNAARDGLPTWSPDGRWLAFVSDRGGTWAVYVMRPDGSGQQLLFELGGSLEGEVAGIPPTEQPGWTWETLSWGR
jgi:hypothetical protein